ncbi:MAG: hypothetical protein E3J96_03140 [Sulfurovum sp.]|nr:MAG: hypothetical protein E3J96_03140 [Sulfurovum sp.]
MIREELLKQKDIIPIEQHPDYHNDIAYDIDDVLDIINDFESRICENCKHWSKEKKQCFNEESIAYTSQEAIYYDDGCNKFVRKVSS